MVLRVNLNLNNMSSYIPDSDKILLAQPFYNIHDTFSRPIAMYKNSEEVVINTNPNNNIFFPDAPFNDQIQNIIVSGMFNARIKYMTREDLNFFANSRGDADDQITIKIEMGMVRIKLDATGAAYLFDAKRVKFDNDIFEPVTSKRPHGLFISDFYTFFLKKIN